MKPKVALAFSGGLDTTYCAIWLREQGYEVHTVTVQTGGFAPDELAAIEARARSLQVTSHKAVDARRELFDDYLRYLIAGNSLRGDLYPLSVSAERVVQAKGCALHGLQIGALVALVLGVVVYLTREGVLRAYTDNPAIVAAAMPLLAWVTVFHIADATQTIAAFVMRAYRVATLPMVIYAVALWGVGLGGGCVIAFNLTGYTPPSLLGAPGFWSACVTGLVLSGVALCSLMHWVLRHKSH